MEEREQLGLRVGTVLLVSVFFRDPRQAYFRSDLVFVGGVLVIGETRMAFLVRGSGVLCSRNVAHGVHSGIQGPAAVFVCRGAKPFQKHHRPGEALSRRLHQGASRYHVPLFFSFTRTKISLDPRGSLAHHLRMTTERHHRQSISNITSERTLNSRSIFIAAQQENKHFLAIGGDRTTFAAPQISEFDPSRQCKEPLAYE